MCILPFHRYPLVPITLKASRLPNYTRLKEEDEKGGISLIFYADSRNRATLEVSRFIFWGMEFEKLSKRRLVGGKMA